jgi:hypothetical protein
LLRRRLELERLEERTVPSTTWVEQGPGVIVGSLNELPGQNNASTGAVEALAVNPTNANIAYAGSVNGGVWRTDNFAAADPLWTPLTDQQLPFLDINSLAISPVNPNEIFAGAGDTSADAFLGGPSFGVARSLDGGKDWQVLGSDVLGGQSIRSIVPTTLDGGRVVLAGSWFAGHTIGNPVLLPGGGVYRSRDGGTTWTQLSGAPGTGLPAESVTDLVADPGNPNRFYAAVEPFAFAHTGKEGVYRSDDGGQTWTQENNGLAGLDTAGRILLAVHSSAAGNAVYAMVNDIIGGPFGTLSGVYRSTDQGGHWTSLGKPPIEIYQNAQGGTHGAIVADPNNPNVVYVAGDTDYTRPGVLQAATVMRGDASQAPNSVWAHLYSDAANNTAPHSDSRALAFDDSGNLVLASDGGVYRLNKPNDPTVRQWRFISTGLSDVEFHNVAYDPLSKVIFGGTQDNGTPIQVNSGKLPWDASTAVPGDGGCVAVDADQTAHSGTSIRYNSAQFLVGFNRSTWDASNHLLGSTLVGLNIVAGPGAGQNLLAFDPFVQFYNPIAVNSVDSTRLLIGTTGLYESFDRGDTLTNLNFSNGSYVGGTSVSSLIANDGYGQPMVYGGRLGRVANPDVIWAGIGNQVVYREHQGDPLQAVSGYHGDYVQTIVADPQNYRHVFVVDGSSQVWASFDAGKTFLNITANLSQLTPFVTTIELVSTGPALQDKMLVAGGANGVFALGPDSSLLHPWYRLGDNLPHAVVLDLHYNANDRLLLAGTLGRGAWTLRNPFGDDLNVGMSGSASPAASISAANLATFSQAPGALDAFFTALGRGSAGDAGSAGAGGDLLPASRAFALPDPAVIPVPAAMTQAMAPAPPSLPAGTDQVVTSPTRVSGTPTSSVARRAAHGPADDWGTDLLTSAGPSWDGEADTWPAP